MKGLLAFACWLFAVGLFAQSPGELSITISNIHPVEGNIFIAIYDNNDDYMDIEKASFQKIAAVESDVQTIIMNNIPAGEYAVSVFHDLNNNGKLDTNAIGIPVEPYGFSNDARGKFGPPKFRNTKFTFKSTREIKIKLVNNDKD